MSSHDAAVRPHDPLADLFRFHRRIERQLAALGELPTAIEVNGVDAHASGAAAALLAFFSTSLELHHADEEALLDLLVARADIPARRDAARVLRQRLEGEHREMDRTWRSLRRPLEGISEGIHRRLPGDLVQYFRACHATHISIEEAGLHGAAVRGLAAGDRAALERGMHARRTRKYRFQ